MQNGKKSGKSAQARSKLTLRKEESQIVGVDDDGIPQTIAAAQQLYHKNNKLVYIHQSTKNTSHYKEYANPGEANTQLDEGKMRIKALIQQARFQQLNQYGAKMGEALEADNKIVNMPQVRVVPGVHKENNFFPLTTKNQAGGFFKDDKALLHLGGASRYESPPKRPRINYEALTAKIQKNVQAGHEQKQPEKVAVYEPANSHHLFDKNTVHLRTMYNQICKKSRHSIQYGDAINSSTSECNTQRDRADPQSLSKEGFLAVQQANQQSFDRLNQYSVSMQSGNFVCHSTPGFSGPGSATDNRRLKPLKGVQKSAAPSQKKIPFYGGVSFHSSYSNWNFQSALRKNNAKSSPFHDKRHNALAGELTVKKTFDDAILDINKHKLANTRKQMKIKVLEPLARDDDDGPELFTAQPSEDIPRNKLTEKLARGLQSYVQRMQKRESFYAELTEIPVEGNKWLPAPREYSTLSYCNRRSFLVGGQNYDTNREIAELDHAPYDYMSSWKNMNFTSNEKIQGRCRHSACVFKDKVYVFGGSYMYNRKRQVRECTAQVMVYDTEACSLNILKTKGVSVQPRKDHCAAIYCSSMIVFGGQYQNGTVTNDIINLDLEYNDWSRVSIKQNVEPFMQSSCCTVQVAKKGHAGGKEGDVSRLSDAILDGIYFFGGKNAKGELLNKLRYLKPITSESKVMTVEWQKIKMQGIPPCGRVGHQLVFLPISQALIVVGGRNDEMCKQLNTPFLDDMHMFLLDQKAWISIKYIPSSKKLCRIGNHAMTVMSDGESFEKILIFGGINNFKDPGVPSLGNQLFIVELKQIM